MSATTLSCHVLIKRTIKMDLYIGVCVVSDIIGSTYLKVHTSRIKLNHVPVHAEHCGEVGVESMHFSLNSVSIVELIRDKTKISYSLAKQFPVLISRNQIWIEAIEAYVCRENLRCYDNTFREHAGVLPVLTSKKSCIYHVFHSLIFFNDMIGSAGYSHIYIMILHHNYDGRITETFDGCLLDTSPTNLGKPR